MYDRYGGSLRVDRNVFAKIHVLVRLPRTHNDRRNADESVARDFPRENHKARHNKEERRECERVNERLRAAESSKH